MLDKLFHFGRLSLVSAALLVLGGCVSSIKITGEIPSALVPQLPIKGAMQYSDEFMRYNYAEKDKKRALKNLDFGQAQVALFDGIFGSVLTLVDPADSAIDLRISPELLDFQYSVPRETKLKLYEVWLKYRIKISDVNDEEIADWVIKGYGKTPTAMLSSASKAFNSATNVAMRDVGAQLAIGFTRERAIEEFLKKKGIPLPGAETQPESPLAVEAAAAIEEKSEDN